MSAWRSLWRRGKGLLFVSVSAVSLGLGLLVVALLLVTTALNGWRLVAMRATADAGLALSQRSPQLEIAAQPVYFQYVTVAQVTRGSAAEALGLRQGDALTQIASQPVSQVSSVWETVEGAAGGRDVFLAVNWVSSARQLLGELTASPIPNTVGQFRVRLSSVAPTSAAAVAGLQPGDLLLMAEDVPIRGTRQAWEAIVMATQRTTGPITLTIERNGEIFQLPLDAERQGRLLVQRDALRALWAFISNLNEPRYPEHAGLISAILGSLYVILVMAAVAFPLGIGAAVYLEEYATRSPLTEALQVLIANLAGVPSVVYGIIGLEIIARAAGLGRSILAGGITLSLLILPIMIIAAREALRTVPPWIREAAYSVGATRWQVVRHHVLPYALPGIFTGMILTLSRAIGEAALLILLGAFLYVTYVPTSLQDSFTVIPLQIFDWATKPQEGFTTIASAAILVLLAILLVLNATAIALRTRFQMRW
jgi:phosphate transport system permease protein